MKAIFSSEWYSPDKVAVQQVDLLGPLPRNWWEAWNESDFFDVNGRRKKGRYVWPPMDQAFEDDIQTYRRKAQMCEYGREETIAILDLMRRMCAFRSEDRPSAEEVLSLNGWSNGVCLTSSDAVTQSRHTIIYNMKGFCLGTFPTQLFKNKKPQISLAA